MCTSNHICICIYLYIYIYILHAYQMETQSVSTPCRPAGPSDMMDGRVGQRNGVNVVSPHLDVR